MSATEVITVQELRRKLEAGEPLQLIDVRSHGEYLAGHIPHALNIPMERCEARLDDLHTNVPVVLVCQSGKRATITRGWIAGQRPQTLVLEGGTTAWAQAGLPIVHEQIATRWALERQVRLGAGLMVLAGTLGSLYLAPGWLWLAVFVGAGLTFAGLTNVCGMAMLLAKAPWNRAAAPATPTQPASAA